LVQRPIFGEDTANSFAEFDAKQPVAVAYAEGMRGRGSEIAKDKGELELIREIRGRAVKAGSNAGVRSGVVLGIGDDCALLRVRPGEEMAITTDLSIEGRHFRMNWHEPETIGHRTLARGLSDLAAMGARPLAAFVSLGLRRQIRGERKQWVKRFYDGLLALAAEYDVPLAGGDLAQSPVMLADIVLAGAVPRGRALRRSGAQPGDAIYVTGWLGGAAAGLEWLRSSKSAVRRFQRAGQRGAEHEALLRAHLYPRPRVAQGQWLMQRRIATGAIDLSDGLSTDLRHVCEESGLSAEVEEASLPIASGASLEQALHGGEDYELLFTAAQDARIPRTIAGVRVTRIGRMMRRKRQPPVTVLTASGPHALEARGWEHFA
jgi:thiamine-monophosphate kinase